MLFLLSSSSISQCCHHVCYLFFKIFNIYNRRRNLISFYFSLFRFPFSFGLYLFYHWFYNRFYNRDYNKFYRWFYNKFYNLCVCLTSRFRFSCRFNLFIACCSVISGGAVGGAWSSKYSVGFTAATITLLCFGFLGFRFGLSASSGSASGNYCGNFCGSVGTSSACSVVAGGVYSDSLIL